MSDQDWPHFTEGACHKPDKKPEASAGNVEAYDVDGDTPTYRNGVSMDQNQPPAPQFGEHPMRVLPYSAADDSLGWCLVSKDSEGYDITVAADIQDHYAVALAERYNALANIPDPQGFVREVRELMERCDWYLEHLNHDEYQALRDDVRSFVARLDALK